MSSPRVILFYTCFASSISGRRVVPTSLFMVSISTAPHLPRSHCFAMQQEFAWRTKALRLHDDCTVQLSAWTKSCNTLELPSLISQNASALLFKSCRLNSYHEAQIAGLKPSTVTLKRWHWAHRACVCKDGFYAKVKREALQVLC